MGVQTYLKLKILLTKVGQTIVITIVIPYIVLYSILKKYLINIILYNSSASSKIFKTVPPLIPSHATFWMHRPPAHLILLLS